MHATTLPSTERNEQMAATIAENIRARRVALGLNQQEFADRCGIHSVTVCRIETGKNGLSAAMLFTIADALGVTADALRSNGETP